MTIRIPFLRWCVALLLLAAAILNYIDRNVLGLLAPAIQADLHITDGQYAHVVSCFLAAYTFAYLVSGRIVDRLGVRVSMALFVAWWSISNALTGLARSMVSLSIFRFMLGLGEAGAFTAAPKAVAEWFPPEERGLAVGFYSVGGAIGATIAPLLVVHVASRFGWRSVFIVTLGLAWTWLACWLLLYRSPHRHPRLTDRERSLIFPPSDGSTKEATGAEAVSGSWREAFAQPFLWRLVLARLLTDPVWYFYQFWMPKYLHTVRGLSQNELSVLWKIFLAADIGFLGGGFLAGRLVKRGLSAPRARLTLLAAAACVVPFSLFLPGTMEMNAMMGLAMAVVCAEAMWLGNLTALVVDIVPRPILGTSFGIVACGSAIGGIFMNETVGWLIHYRSYTDCFYLMAFLHPVALFFLWKLRARSSVV